MNLYMYSRFKKKIPLDCIHRWAKCDRDFASSGADVMRSVFRFLVFFGRNLNVSRQRVSMQQM